MNRNELELMRLLHGELPEERARELRSRMERDPALAGEYRSLQRSWEGLSLPPAAAVPPGFAQRVTARARSESGLSWSLAPGWVRATAAAALVIGTALGVGVGGSWPSRETATVSKAETPVIEDPSGTVLEDSLAESYWTALEDLEP